MEGAAGMTVGTVFQHQSPAFLSGCITLPRDQWDHASQQKCAAQMLSLLVSYRITQMKRSRTGQHPLCHTATHHFDEHRPRTWLQEDVSTRETCCRVHLPWFKGFLPSPEDTPGRSSCWLKFYRWLLLWQAFVSFLIMPNTFSFLSLRPTLS